MIRTGRIKAASTDAEPILAVGPSFLSLLRDIFMANDLAYSRFMVDVHLIVAPAKTNPGNQETSSQLTSTDASIVVVELNMVEKVGVI